MAADYAFEGGKAVYHGLPPTSSEQSDAYRRSLALADEVNSVLGRVRDMAKKAAAQDVCRPGQADLNGDLNPEKGIVIIDAKHEDPHSRDTYTEKTCLKSCQDGSFESGLLPGVQQYEHKLVIHEYDFGDESVTKVLFNRSEQGEHLEFAADERRERCIMDLSNGVLQVQEFNR